VTSYLSRVVEADIVIELARPPVKPPRQIARLRLACPNEQLHVVRRRRVNAIPLRAFCPSCGPVALAAFLLKRPDTDPRLVAAHVRELFQASKALAHEAVLVLADAARHPDESVRLAAAYALGAHPYPAAFDLLGALSNDRRAAVREAADQAHDAMWAVPPECIHCGSENHREPVRLPGPTNYHSMPSRWPAFCSPECAIAYALDRVQEDVDDEEIHECLASGRWERCSLAACQRCAAVEWIGRPEEGAAPAPPKKKKRAKSAAAAR
jgi:hypothetical protein